MQTRFSTQTPSNNNNIVQPSPGTSINTVPTQSIEEMITGIVALQLQQSLWYQVQCVSCEKAADALNVETDTVRHWIKAGKLPASKIGKDWSIRLIDVDKMLKLNATIVRLPDMRMKKYKANKAS